MINLKLHAPPISIRTESLEVKLATKFSEIDAAMRLRFEVFNLELQEGLKSSFDKGYDSDAYDAYCDHLIVIDHHINKVVGTYRLLPSDRANSNIGFYSENEFDISNLKKLPGQLLELGRSCIAASHRSFAVINLLWSAIGAYANNKNIQYLFGCGSLHYSDQQTVQKIYSHLRSDYFAPENFRVYPLPACRMNVIDDGESSMESKKVMRMLPPIMRGYLRAGAMICGEPAFDDEFGTADLPIILSTDKINATYKDQYL